MSAGLQIAPAHATRRSLPRGPAGATSSAFDRSYTDSARVWVAGNGTAKPGEEKGTTRCVDRKQLAASRACCRAIGMRRTCGVLDLDRSRSKR